jgi:hypothetical protein
MTTPQLSDTQVNSMIDSLLYSFEEMRHKGRFDICALHHMAEVFDMSSTEFPWRPLSLPEKAYASLREFHMRKISSLTKTNKAWLKKNLELAVSPLMKLDVTI